MSLNDTQKKIDLVCKNIADFLKEKNNRYGDSALSPINIFSKNDVLSSITIRLDDKLSRIKKAKSLKKNDVVDIVGYLILLMIDAEWTDFSDLID